MDFADVWQVLSCSHGLTLRKPTGALRARRPGSGIATSRSRTPSLKGHTAWNKTEQGSNVRYSPSKKIETGRREFGERGREIDLKQIILPGEVGEERSEEEASTSGLGKIVCQEGRGSRSMKRGYKVTTKLSRPRIKVQRVPEFS